MRSFFDYLKNEDGQTSTEYILLVVVVVMMVMKFRTTLTERLTKLTDGAFDKTDQLLEDAN